MVVPTAVRLDDWLAEPLAGKLDLQKVDYLAVLMVGCWAAP